MISLKYIIVGTGRCGTVSLARLLTDAGIPCGHESIFDWKGIRWAKDKLEGNVSIDLSYVAKMKYSKGKWIEIPEWLHTTEIEAESSYMAVPFLGEQFLNATKKIHLVRNPIRVVDSFCHHLNYFKKSSPSNSYEKFIYKTVPELEEEISEIDRACLYYVRWNQLIESNNPDFFHRIEDDTKILFEFLDVKNPVQCKKVNSIKKSGVGRFELSQIEDKKIKDEFVDMGRHYGYNMSSDYLMI